jgi:hypothetical protein
MEISEIDRITGSIVFSPQNVAGKKKVAIFSDVCMIRAPIY